MKTIELSGVTGYILKNPYPNGNENPDVFKEYTNMHNEIAQKLSKGERVYIGYLQGEREGTIGYIHSYEQSLVKFYRHAYRPNMWYCTAGYSVKLAFDDRRNRIKHYLDFTAVYFPDYTGPTIWKKFDRIAAETEALESTEVRDRDGNQLSIGDHIIYINARYGAAMQLDRGVIDDIKIKVSKYGKNTYEEIHVVIEREDGEKSIIKQPNLSIMLSGVK